MRGAKSQLEGQFALERRGPEPLAQQIVRQLREAIDAGRVGGGTRLPSSRSFARTLGVSRNTVLAAYDELHACGFLRGRRGAGVHVVGVPPIAGLDLEAIMREAQYPLSTLTVRDPDANPISLMYYRRR